MEPAERSCALGRQIIVVNWFNVCTDGKEDGGGVFLPPRSLHSSSDEIRYVITVLSVPSAQKHNCGWEGRYAGQWAHKQTCKPF